MRCWACARLSCAAKAGRTIRLRSGEHAIAGIDSPQAYQDVRGLGAARHVVHSRRKRDGNLHVPDSHLASVAVLRLVFDDVAWLRFERRDQTLHTTRPFFDAKRLQGRCDLVFTMGCGRGPERKTHRERRCPQPPSQARSQKKKGLTAPLKVSPTPPLPSPTLAHSRESDPETGAGREFHQTGRREEVGAGGS